MKCNHNDYDFSLKKQNLPFITSKTHNYNDLKTDSAFLNLSSYLILSTESFLALGNFGYSKFLKM